MSFFYEVVCDECRVKTTVGQSGAGADGLSGELLRKFLAGHVRHPVRVLADCVLDPDKADDYRDEEIEEGSKGT